MWSTDNHQHIHMYIYTTHTIRSDYLLGSGGGSRDHCKRATYAKLKTKGRRCHCHRCCCRAKNNTCTALNIVTLREGGNRPAFTLCNYRCFFSSTLPTSCNVNNFAQIFTLKSQSNISALKHTLAHTHGTCMQFLLFGPSAICKLVLYRCVPVWPPASVCSVVASANFLSVSAYIFKCNSQCYYILLKLKM